VVLVDDDLDTAQMYQLGLQLLGFEVAVARDGPSLFASLREDLPDIVVLDWDLPGQRGDEVLRHLREDARTMDLPVVMLSNFPAMGNGHVDSVFEAGALAWFEKMNTPPQSLAAKLREALAARAVR
jgi:two-component system phosphate regulon response regulator PhoB